MHLKSHQNIDWHFCPWFSAWLQSPALMNILPNILTLEFSTQEVEICITRLVLAGRRETRVWQVQTLFEQDMMCFKSVWVIFVIMRLFLTFWRQMCRATRWGMRFFDCDNEQNMTLLFEQTTRKSIFAEILRCKASSKKRVISFLLVQSNRCVICQTWLCRRFFGVDRH